MRGFCGFKLRPKRLPSKAQKMGGDIVDIAAHRD